MKYQYQKNNRTERDQFPDLSKGPVLAPLKNARKAGPMRISNLMQNQSYEQKSKRFNESVNSGSVKRIE